MRMKATGADAEKNAVPAAYPRATRRNRNDAPEDDEEDQLKAKQPRRTGVCTPVVADEDGDDAQDARNGQQNVGLEDTADANPDCDLEDIEELARVESGDIPFHVRNDGNDVTLNSDCRSSKIPPKATVAFPTVFAYT